MLLIIIIPGFILALFAAYYLDYRKNKARYPDSPQNILYLLAMGILAFVTIVALYKILTFLFS